LFVGDSSARLLDFINAAIPDLGKRFASHGQQFRAGVDFGLVHLSENELTGKSEFFDLPGIRAARLQQAAKPGQMLCTDTVQKIFDRQYPEMFSKRPMDVRTKDRNLVAFEVNPLGWERVIELLTDYFFGSKVTTRQSVKRRTKFLFVDDEPTVQKLMGAFCQADWPEYEVFLCSNGREALEAFRPGEFALVFVDMVMPLMDGVELTRRLVTSDPEVPVVMMTAYHSESNLRPFFAAGGSYCVEKPCSPSTFHETVVRALTCPSPQAIRNALGIVCADPGYLMWSLDAASRQFRSILSNVGRAEDRAHALLRHQARGIITSLIASIRPGSDIAGLHSRLLGQLACIARLSNVVGRRKESQLHLYLARHLADLRILYPQVEIALEVGLKKKARVAIQNAGVVVLIVAELIDNAISALNGPGRIEVKISALTSTGLLQIVVQDSGPGIPPHLANHVFEEGVSSKGAGRGYGLALIRGALGFGGEIHYEYRDGATFRVVLPAT
jgi:CheY-like chemotaxis protein